jgi:hypothetical protein
MLQTLLSCSDNWRQKLLPMQSKSKLPLSSLDDKICGARGPSFAIGYAQHLKTVHAKAVKKANKLPKLWQGISFPLLTIDN